MKLDQLQKRLMLLSLSFICLSFVLLAQSNSEGYHLKVKIDDYANDTLILGYRFGSKTYVKDTVVGVDSKGFFHFRGDTLLKGGVYLVLIKPSNNFFEFLISNDRDQAFTLRTRLVDNDLSNNLSVEGSADNKVFFDYLQYLIKMSEKNKPWQTRLTEIDKALQDSNTGEPQKSSLLKEQQSLQNKSAGLDKEVDQYQQNLIARHPSFLATKLIQASAQPKVPETITDRTQQFLYYKKHYWDGFDWGDSRLIRTPVFEQKLEVYLDKLTYQEPDSQIVACDYLLGQVIKAEDKDMLQFAASQLLNKFAKTKVICMDKVYVHLGSTYYCGTNKADWLDEEQLAKICKNVDDLSNTLCGIKAGNIKLTNIATGQPVSLYDIKAQYTLVYFWDPNCSTCTKTTEKLVPVYNKWKAKGFEVYGVCSESLDEIEPAKEKINKMGMNWINTSDKPYPLLQVKKLYNVKSNPTLYLLDKDKKILYKRLDPQQVDEILTNNFEE